MKRFIGGLLLVGTVLSTRGDCIALFDWTADLFRETKNATEGFLNRLDNPDGINVELDNKTGKDFKIATTGRGQNGLERCAEAVSDMVCPTTPTITISAGKKETVMFRNMAIPVAKTFKFKVLVRSGATFSRCEVDSATRGKTYRFVVDNSGTFGKIKCKATS